MGKKLRKHSDFLFFSLLVDESNMVTLVSALKLSKGIPLRHDIP